jgi:hypothetical protein
LRPVLLALFVGCVAHAYTPGEKVDKDFADFAAPFLDRYCVDCHDEVEAKGNLNLLDLEAVDETNAEVWKSVWAQVSLKAMPPKKKRQPGVVERLQMADWIVGELQREMADKGGFHAHRDPLKGNFVDHDLLFSDMPEGIELAPAASPARLWRVTPQEHITRLNELINREPEYDPERPGLRTRGDVVPTNHGGELKLYFGTDRILKWQGGTVAYATAVKSLPAVLSTARHHGLENYPDFYSVNSAEATQILGLAEDVIRYMAYGPLSIAKPEQITDDPNSYKMDGDIRGLPTSLVYSTKVTRPLTPVYELLKEDGHSDAQLRPAIDFLFEAITFRPPSPAESAEYLAIVKQTIDKLGKADGVVLGLASIFVDPEALFRAELGAGRPDAHGRIMLQDWELGLAVNHALRYIKPDDVLRQAIIDGRMRSRADVQRELARMLADPSIRKPRVLRFFRDFFDHDLAGYICKDDRALAATGASNQGQSYYRSMFDATASTDRLIELILAEDKQVLRTLLTTDKVVATSADKTFFGKKNSKEEQQAAADAAKIAAAEAMKAEQAELEVAQQELVTLEAQLAPPPAAEPAGLSALLETGLPAEEPAELAGILDSREQRLAKKAAEQKKTREVNELKKKIAAARKRLTAAERQLSAAKKSRKGRNTEVTPAALSGPRVFARVSRRSFGAGSLKPERILAEAPPGQRLGILTHPSWLVSHSDAMDNHAILRGRWIRERLLGGGIPDVPITVDAMLPDEPDKSLRERMRVTREDYCWTCHQKMDPLGLPFEMYNHAGLFRTQELGKPVDTSGEIIDSGDPALDGPVTNAIDMIEKLAASERVEQVFVRHAFRFWMGRNETLNDAPVLRAAHRAYKDSGGSMNALIISLVTSDAFLYRQVK